MESKQSIADSELPIIKILWENENLTQPEIYDKLGNNQNKSTFKTLLNRLVSKGCIQATKVNSRTYLYSAIVSKDEYISSEQTGFIKRVFDGSKDKMLLNFVKNEKISKADLLKLIDLIDED